MGLHSPQSRIAAPRSTSRTFSAAVFALVLSACMHRSEFVPEFTDMSGPTNYRGIMKSPLLLGSVSFLDGEIETRSGDYGVFAEHDGVAFAALDGDGAAREFALHSRDGARRLERIAEEVRHSERRLGFPKPTGLRILLVPRGYRYARRKLQLRGLGATELEFAFHYAPHPDEPDLDADHFGTAIMATLAHELVHFAEAKGRIDPPNALTEEVLATVTDVCVTTRHTGRLPKRVASILPDDATMAKLRRGTHTQLVEVMSGNTVNVPANVFAQLVSERLRARYGEEGAAEAMLRYCDAAFARDVDFTQSLELEGIL